MPKSRPGASSAQRVLRFGVRFVPYFVATLVVYLSIVPVYRAAVVATANALTARLSPPTRVEVGKGGELVAYVQDAGESERALQSWAPFVSHLLFLSVALLPALILATPVAWPSRLRVLALGVSLMLVVNVVALAGLVRLTRRLYETPDAFVCLWLLRLVYASGQLSAAVIWGGLTWRTWFPVARRN